VSELRVLSMRLIEVEEAERRSISRELHDRTGANVAALHITLGLLAEKLADGNLGAAESLVADARQVLAQTSSELRNIMSELRPSALDDFGLYAALLGYAKSITARLGIALDAAGGPIEPRPPSAVETALFRIAQEALTNAAKHAHAKRLGIGLHVENGVLVLEVSDDGVGFNTAQAGRTNRHGMRTMRERAEAIRATLTVRSARGAGTHITVKVPLT
jgi:signal transduction histidine kinase